MTYFYDEHSFYLIMDLMNDSIKAWVSDITSVILDTDNNLLKHKLYS